MFTVFAKNVQPAGQTHRQTDKTVNCSFGLTNTDTDVLEYQVTYPPKMVLPSEIMVDLAVD
jgi:hypothetical protein